MCAQLISGEADAGAPLPAQALAHRFSAIARRLAGRSIDQLRAEISAVAVETVPGAEHAGVTLLRDTNFQTVGPTGERPSRVDAIQ